MQNSKALILLAIICLSGIATAANTNYAGFTYSMLDLYRQKCFDTAAIDCADEVDKCTADLAAFGFPLDGTKVVGAAGCWDSTQNGHKCTIWHTADTGKTASDALVDETARDCIQQCFGDYVITTGDTTIKPKLEGLQDCLYDIKDEGFKIPNFGEYTYTQFATAQSENCLQQTQPTCTDADTACKADLATRNKYFTTDHADKIPFCIHIGATDGWTLINKVYAQPTTGSTVIDGSLFYCINSAFTQNAYTTKAWKDWAKCQVDTVTKLFLNPDQTGRKWNAMYNCEAKGICVELPSCESDDGKTDNACAANVKKFDLANQSGACRWGTYLQGESAEGDIGGLPITDYMMECWKSLYIDTTYTGTYLPKYKECDWGCFKSEMKNDNPKKATYSALTTCQTTNTCTAPDCDALSAGADKTSCIADKAKYDAATSRQCVWSKQLDGISTAHDAADVIDFRTLDCWDSLTYAYTPYTTYKQCQQKCVNDIVGTKTTVTLQSYNECLTQADCKPTDVDVVCPDSGEQKTKCDTDARQFKGLINHAPSCHADQLLRYTGQPLTDVVDQTFLTCKVALYKDTTFESDVYKKQKECENTCIKNKFPEKSVNSDETSDNNSGSLLGFSLFALLAFLL